MYAITLFKIQEKNKLRITWNGQKLNIRPRMLEIESVIEFKDYYITNSQDSGYDFVEVIKISNINDFENDNKKTIGLKIANDWLEWVDNYKIIYCDNF